MKKWLGLFALLFLATPCVAQQATAIGPIPPCSAFGTASGTCVQGAGALGTPSSGVATNLTGLPLTTGVTGNLSPSNGGKPANRYTNFTNSTTFTFTSATLLMGGYGSSWALTPTTTGRVRITVIGYVSVGAASAVTMNVRYGTGTAPVQGAAVSGSGGTSTDLVSSATPFIVPFMMYYEATSLTLSTAYWFDVTARAGVSSTITPISITIEEF